MTLQNILIAQWYEPKLWGWLLWPFAKVFQCLVTLRQYAYSHGWLKSTKVSVPVVIVGNLSVGGTGKTPLVIALAKLLLAQGLRPGIVLRGYKSHARGAIRVHSNMDPALVGDEALVLSKRCSCPVVVAKQRVLGARKLIADHKVDIILCDDGLQHYALARDIEIAVVDGERGFGNGHCLPMGPLRETPERLQDVDLVITNGQDMHLNCDSIYSLLNNQRFKISDFAGQTVHAIAGIGTPNRFFSLLQRYGIKVIPHAFADHHEFKMQDLSFADHLPVLMTEKDAVKCSGFASSRCWVVPVDIILTPNIVQRFGELIQGVLHDR